MGFNISLLTLYAILFSMEEDMRELILLHLDEQMETSALLELEIYIF